MPLSVAQFVDQLTSSGLLSADEISAFRKQSSAATDAEPLARELVRSKKLTAYQAQQAYAGKAKTLVLGNYLVLDKLGQGGMGMVLKAQHRRMNRIVALKVLSPAITKTKDVVARFHREVQAAARLEHPNIVAAYDADEAQRTHFLVMQYVDGQDLSSLVKRKGTLPVEQAVNCIVQAARGLQFAHEHGVIHRDIKPANLLLDAKGTVKILDMGLARIEGDTGAQAEITNTGAVMGTVDYMAPEQARNTKAADARSDIYSLGITLWYLLVGKPAYDGATITERLLAHQTDPIPSLRARRPDVPASVDAVFQKLVAKRPADRYQTMNDVIVALEACQRGDAPAAAPTLPVAPSDDSQFNAFLAGLAHTDPGTHPSKTGRARSPSAVLETIGDAPTRTDALPESATDPSVSTGKLKRAPVRRAAPPAPRTWWQDRRVQIAGGAALLVLLALGLLIPGRPEPVSKVEPPETSAPSVAVPTVATFKSGLSFQEGDAVKAEHVPYRPETEVTLEVWVTVEAVDPGYSQGIVRLPNGSLGIFGNDLRFYTYHGHVEASGVLVPGRRTHVAGVNDGKTRKLFIDGKLVAEINDPGGPWVEGIAGNHDHLLVIGGERFWGVIDAVRVSSVGRYTADFTPPATFGKDKDTFALYQFDEGRGDILGDSSGHGYLGKIVGATWVRADGSPLTGATAPVSESAVVAGPTVSAFPWPFDPPDGRVYGWSEPENLGPEINTRGTETILGLSEDGLSMFWYQDGALRTSQRRSLDAPFGPPVHSDRQAAWTIDAAISGDGFLIVTNLQNAEGRETLWSGTRLNPFERFDLQRMDAPVNAGASNRHPVLSPDGLTLVVTSSRRGGGHGDVWMFTRDRRDQPFGQPARIGPPVNTPDWEMPFFITNDRLVLVVASQDSQGRVFRVFTRQSAADSFDPGVEIDIPLGPAKHRDNGGYHLSPDGRTLYFSTHHLPSGFGQRDIWVTRRVPVGKSAAINVQPDGQTGFSFNVPELRWPLTPTKPELIRDLLDRGLELKIRTGPLSDIPLTSTTPLNETPATVVGVVLTAKSEPTDDALLAIVGSLNDLEFLKFEHSANGHGSVTAAGLKHLASLGQMRSFAANLLSHNATGSADLLKSWPNLEYLHLPYGSADEWAAVAAGLPRLVEINAYRAQFTDAGLKSLEGMPQLKAINLYDSQVTSPGIDRFAQAVPGCRITYRVGDSEQVIEPRSSSTSR